MKNILKFGLLGLLMSSPALALASGPAASASASAATSASASASVTKEVKKVVPGKVEEPAAVATKKPATNVDDDLRKALTARLAGGSGEMTLTGTGLETKAPTVASGASAGSAAAAKRKAAAQVEAEKMAHAHTAHWSYEGEGSPENWGKMNKDYTLCESGKRQSPIDIRGGINVDLPALKFNYLPSLFRVVDNGHTIQVNYGEGSMLTVQGRQYQLVQFHFHKPSEERVNGRVYDMVVHLVHKDEQGRLAVVAVLLDKGAEHPLIQTVWNNLPLERNEEVSPPEAALDINQLLPDNLAYMTYMGSLTTPPCSEGVTWIVLKQPAKISSEQIAVFNRLYKNNARPIQRVEGRLIKESR